MNKNRQTILVRWLKSQSKMVKYWLHLSMLFGMLIALTIIAQAWSLAALLQAVIIDHTPRARLTGNFIVIILLFTLRAVLNYSRDRIGFIAGSLLRRQIRAQLMNRLECLGPTWIRSKPAGSWSSIIIEQIENLHDFYARYLPQMWLAVMVPLMILVVVFPTNWAAGLILVFTAPLIPLFMVLVGVGAANANRRNFQVLARLSGHFLDRLRGMETVRLFFRAEAETDDIFRTTKAFRQRTMEVLRLAFLSSSVLEFFTSISIAVTAVYFGFSYFGALNFGSYGTSVTLFAGFLVLILAPEFFQPLRDLGTFYHAQAQAVGAAESLVSFFEKNNDTHGSGYEIPVKAPISLRAHNLLVLAHDGSKLAGPLNFVVSAGQRVAIVGASGAGKSSIISVLLGFLPYRGSLQINGQELRSLSPHLWREQLSWISQNPSLPASTLRDNVLLGFTEANNEQLTKALNDAYVSEFLDTLPDGINSKVGEYASSLSVGQAQRVALARALIRTPGLLLLDEPTANLDVTSERLVMCTLQIATIRQTTLLVTHQPQVIADFDVVWVMSGGIITQQGSYAELAASGGALANLIPCCTQER